jgi:protein-tyrosine kinase
LTRLTEALARAEGQKRDAAHSFDNHLGERTVRKSDALAQAEGQERDAADLFDYQLGDRAAGKSEALARAEGHKRDAADSFDYQLGARSAGKVVVGIGAEMGLIEQYRRLAAVLHHAQLQRGTRSVMIASAVAGEGKTLTATNLALTLSRSYQRRVLLIDADLRRPDLHEMFRLQNHVGLGDGLKHPDVYLPAQQISPTLWVLAAGQPNPDPMSALVSDTMKQLLAEATRQYDWVLVDTPPVALMPDANLLAGMIDSALVIVSANTTPYPLVRVAVAAIGPARVLGVVLNRVKKSDLASGYYSKDYTSRHPGPSRRDRPWFGAQFFRRIKA